MKIKRTTILYVMNTIVSSFVSSDSYASDNERSDFRSFENNQSNIQFSEIIKRIRKHRDLIYLILIQP